MEDRVDVCRGLIADRPDWAAAHHNLGMYLYNQDRVEEAIAALNQALTLDPCLAESLSQLGLVYLRRSDFVQAESLLRRAVAASPDDSLAQGNLGIALWRLGRLEEAVANLRAAVAAEPDIVDRHYALGCVFVDLNRMDEAVRCFGHAATLDIDRGKTFLPRLCRGRFLKMPAAVVPAAATAPEVLVLDAGLRDMTMHFFNYGNALRQAAEEAGVPMTFFSHVMMSSEVVAALKPVPTFRLSTYSAVDGDADFNLLAVSRIFYEDLVSITDRVGPHSTVFFHTVIASQLPAIAQWVEMFTQERRPSTVILLRHVMTDAELPTYRLAMAILKRPEMRVRLCSDTRDLADHYAGKLSCRPDVVPIPHVSGSPASDHPEPTTTLLDAYAPALAAAIRDPDTAVVGYAGDTHPRKGFLFLSQIVHGLRQSGVRFHMAVQISNAEYTGAHAGEILAEVACLRSMAGADLTLIEGALPAPVYRAFIGACDVILLSCYPLADFYRYQSSGVFAEALAAEKVVVVPQGTWMANEAGRVGAGFRAFAGFSAPAIADEVAEAIRNLPELRARAQATGPVWRGFHTARRLLDYLVSDTPPAEPTVPRC